MFSIEMTDQETIALRGRFDAAQTEKANAVLEKFEGSGAIDFSECDYIASAGLGQLFATQKRLHDAGHSLTLRNLSPHLREIFQLAGFDKIFTIEESE